MGALGEQEATSAWTLGEEQIDDMYQLLELSSFCVLLRLQRKIREVAESLPVPLRKNRTIDCHVDVSLRGRPLCRLKHTGP